MESLDPDPLHVEYHPSATPAYPADPLTNHKHAACSVLRGLRGPCILCGRIHNGDSVYHVHVHVPVCAPQLFYPFWALKRTIHSPAERWRKQLGFEHPGRVRCARRPASTRLFHRVGIMRCVSSQVEGYEWGVHVTLRYEHVCEGPPLARESGVL